MVLARQPEGRAARHPRVAGHGVLDRRPLRVPEMEGTGDVGRRLDDDEGRLRLSPPDCQRRRGRRHRPPASARRCRPRRWPRRRPWAAPWLARRPSPCLHPASPVSRNRTPRSSQRTNGVVVPPAGSVAAPSGHPGRGSCRGPLGALSGATRHDSRATFTRPWPRGLAAHDPRSLAAVRRATPLGPCREAPSLALRSSAGHSSVTSPVPVRRTAPRARPRRPGGGGDPSPPRRR